MKKNLIAVALLLVLFSLPAGAQTSTSVTYTWTAPTTGSPCVSYEVERTIDAGTTWVAYTTTTSTTAIVVAPANVAIQIRVRGVDALGRKGPWSQPADPYSYDPGAPGSCGKPARQP